jgi:hypothetical protein
LDPSLHLNNYTEDTKMKSRSRASARCAPRRITRYNRREADINALRAFRKVLTEPQLRTVQNYARDFGMSLGDAAYDLAKRDWLPGEVSMGAYWIIGL